MQRDASPQRCLVELVALDGGCATRDDVGRSVAGEESSPPRENGADHRVFRLEAAIGTEPAEYTATERIHAG
jgi:hypothetical protein